MRGGEGQGGGGGGGERGREGRKEESFRIKGIVERTLCAVLICLGECVQVLDEKRL